MEIRIVIPESDSNDPEVLLYHYLRSSKIHSWSYREKVISAIRSWWLPLALKEAGASDSDIRDHTLAAIHCMKNQIWYLENLLERTPQPDPHAVSASIEKSSIPFNSPALQPQAQATSSADDYPLRLD